MFIVLHIISKAVLFKNGYQNRKINFYYIFCDVEKFLHETKTLSKLLVFIEEYIYGKSIKLCIC